MKILADRLKELRKEKKISLEKLANKLNITDTAILNWEQNKTEPIATNIKNIAIFFNVTSDYLLGLEDETGAKTDTDNINKNVINSFNNSNISGNIKI